VKKDPACQNDVDKQELCETPVHLLTTAQEILTIREKGERPIPIHSAVYRNEKDHWSSVLIFGGLPASVFFLLNNLFKLNRDRLCRIFGLLLFAESPKEGEALLARYTLSVDERFCLLRRGN